MAIDLVDTSGQPGVDHDALRSQAAFLLDRLLLDPDTDVSIALVDEEEMTRLHVTWMDEPGPTDVLSFPMDDLRPGKPGEPRAGGVLGDVILCPGVAARQAEQAGHSLDRECALLLTHGMLHLLGYDHAEPEEHARMFTLQDELLDAWWQAGAP